MVSDKFNNDFKNGLGGKFRDKKFVSIVAIGIFVLILAIVLIVKGCGGSGNVDDTQKGRGDELQEQSIDEKTQGKEETEEERAQRLLREGQELLREGQNYMNGTGGRSKDYEKAFECFSDAKRLGVKDADAWIGICERKLKQAEKNTANVPKKN